MYYIWLYTTSCQLVKYRISKTRPSAIIIDHGELKKIIVIITMTINR